MFFFGQMYALILETCTLSGTYIQKIQFSNLFHKNAIQKFFLFWCHSY